jgi:hypothetical protein
LHFAHDDPKEEYSLQREDIVEQLSAHMVKVMAVPVIDVSYIVELVRVSA